MKIKLINTKGSYASCSFCGEDYRDYKNKMITFETRLSNFSEVICESCLKELYREGVQLFEREEDNNEIF